jgi:outer membrane protein TolC
MGIEMRSRRGIGARSAAGRLAVALLALSPPGCTAAWYSKDADREVGGVLDEFNEQALADRAGRLKLPEPKKEEPATEPGPQAGEEAAREAQAEGSQEPAEPGKPPLVLDVRTTLEIALRQSRQFKDAREGLYLQGLGFTFTRFGYIPQLDAAVSYLWGDGDGAPAASSSGASLGVSQLLPTNGTLSLSGGLVKSWARDDGGAADDWSTSAAISLSQPLLRGGGYDLYREELTQAERSMLYAVRDFELFRQQFTIDTTQQFFDLVAQQRKLANNAHDVETAIFEENKFVALKAVGRALDRDVINARRRRLSSESTYADARTDFRRSVQRFLIDLGLDPNTPVELVEDEPPFEPVSFDSASAVEVAMHNRLDVQTRRQQLEDAERQFRLARNNLLPDLNVAASYSSGGSGPHPGPALPDTWSRSASASLEIPLQTIDRRNAWRSAEISIARTRRDWDLFVDAVRSGVEDQIRQLANTERQIELAAQSIEDEMNATELLEFRVEQGTADARDLTDARQRLVDQRNNLIDLKVEHLRRRLTLYKDLGILFIGADGTWSVGAPPAEEGR